MQWIVDRRKNPKIVKNVTASESAFCEEEPDWMRDFVADSSDTLKLQPKVKTSKASPRKKSIVRIADGTSFDKLEEIEDAEFLLEEYDSGGDGSLKCKKREMGSCWSSSEEEDEAFEVIEERTEVTPKIYFCSRTHSQLSQFVNEFKKTKFSDEINAICLGSRKNLCINKGLRAFSNDGQFVASFFILYFILCRRIKVGKSKQDQREVFRAAEE